MSDNPARSTEYTLLGTDNAMTWAEEFCRIFNNKTVVVGNESGQFIDEGTMVGWFANAMQTAVMIHEKRRAVTEAEPESALWINEADRIDYAAQFDEEEAVPESATLGEVIEAVNETENGSDPGVFSENDEPA